MAHDRCGARGVATPLGKRKGVVCQASTGRSGAIHSPNTRRVCSIRISSAMLVRDKRKPFVLIFGFMKLAGMQ